jgi:hypothetical protein
MGTCSIYYLLLTIDFIEETGVLENTHNFQQSAGIPEEFPHRI